MLSDKNIERVNTVFSVGYCWAWMIPLVAIMMALGPNEITQFELYELYFLCGGWWLAYPPQVIKHFTKGHSREICMIQYWLVTTFAAVLLGVIYFK